MSDKIKAAADVATPIVEVVTAGAEKLAHGAPVVVETGAEAVEVMVGIVDRAPLGKKVLIGAAVALGLGATAGLVAFWAARRKNTVTLEEVAEAVAEGVEKGHTAK